MALLPSISRYLSSRQLIHEDLPAPPSESAASLAHEGPPGTSTLGEAVSQIATHADQQTLVLVGPPGVGKTVAITSAARAAGLPCHTLLGTQLVPEDILGVPRIEDDRTVFCPPRVLLPKTGAPFLLFLDELTSAAPEVQKALYSIMLERRIGEHPLPAGSWVVAAGNATHDRSLAHEMSAALLNRVFLIKIRADPDEWHEWAERHGIRAEIRRYIARFPEALMRAVPERSAPFSTPRAWAHLSQAFDRLEVTGTATPRMRAILAFGRVSALDAEGLLGMDEAPELPSARACVVDPRRIPDAPAERWLVLDAVRRAVTEGVLDGVSQSRISNFLGALSPEELALVLTEHVEVWGALGGDGVLLAAYRRLTQLGEPWLRAVAAR